jgi:hypothetical protein
MNHQELDGELISEKAVSSAQQRFMGMVYAAKKGEKPASPEVAKAAKGMSKKEAKKFASTKHKGLPETVKESGYFPTPESQRKDEAKYNLRGQTVKPRTPQTQLGAKMKPQTPVKEESECGMGDKPKLKKSESDVREIPTKVNLVKNKLRAMGLKMSYEPDGEMVDEGQGEFRSLGRADQNRGRNRYMGGGTPEDMAYDKKRGDAAATRAVEQLRRRRAAEERRKQEK